MMKRKALTQFGIAMVILLSLFLVPWACVYFSNPNPPIPEIKYGEFPFRLEYEINGQRVVVEDTIICKFDGVGVSWGIGDGKYLKWKAYLASGRKQPDGYSIAVLIDEKNEIYVSTGSSQYYLGVESATLNFHTFRIQRLSYGQLHPTVSEDELLNTYGIKLISFEPSLPIVNTFK